ncbi:J domain-containing protein [Vibrio sp. CAU 1672]|uniref:J domain-containing protein n=1 Tax=Vibrio sp. CAU 1672 TaxID=3032594 RepID=UPI0023DB80EB|nr:J domain-containing protein [Vibrio sp. CAU 1672]MDF2152361.1 J domain-containing protein [Vibrio sp. CAU 1672]
MSRRTILSLAAMACISLPAYATEPLTDPVAQYQQAQNLAKQASQSSLPEVRYWLEQSAQQGHLAAQKQLAKDYADGLSGKVNYPQAIYWFTTIANQDATDHGYLLAQFLQQHQQQVNNHDLIEAWYKFAAENNPQAETAYAIFLEQRFNQLRAKQVTEITELEQQQTTENQQGTPQPPAQSAINSDWLYPSTGFAITMILAGSWFGFRRKADKRQNTVHQQQLTKEVQLETQVKELQFTNRQLKRQLETVFQEFRKTQQQSDQHKLAIACAMFGYTPASIPEDKSVRLRYRQLSKLYHPDTRGSEEEMKRLNQAFNTITQKSTKN